MRVLQSQLIEQIRHYEITDSTPEILSFEGDISHSASLLSWLKAQSEFPQFYFSSRSNQQVWVALGKVRSFFTTNTAEQFSLENKLPLVGGLTFDKQAYFFLPRFLFSQTEQNLRLQFFVQREELNNKNALVEILNKLEKSTALLSLPQRIQPLSQQATSAQWCDWVEKALAHIQQGKFNKVVLANKRTFLLSSPLNATDFVAESEKWNKDCYHFLFAQDKNSAFVGASPERLYQRQQRQLFTEALAGTAAVSHNAEEDQGQSHWLLQDKKNIFENQLVAEGICQALLPYTSEIQQSDLTIKKLRQVQHLYREIQATLKENCGDQRCLQVIHPTAAVSGLPQSEAIEFIQNTENFDRTWYAGTLGIMSPDYAEFCVTIRSATIEENKIAIYAGAGIVEGSIPLLEWQEIERKATGLLSLFGNH